MIEFLLPSILVGIGIALIAGPHLAHSWFGEKWLTLAIPLLTPR